MSYLKLKCNIFDFGWGAAPDPAGGAFSVPSNPLVGFKGPLLRAVTEGRLEGRTM